MTPPRMSREDAIEVYAFTLAYLYHEKFDSAAVTDTMYVKEVSPEVFHFWRRQPSARQAERIVPAAKCAYDSERKMWRVELARGETLSLLDQGKEWEVVGEKAWLPTLSSRKKSYIPRRGATRSNK